MSKWYIAKNLTAFQRAVLIILMFVLMSGLAALVYMSRNNVGFFENRFKSEANKNFKKSFINRFIETVGGQSKS